MLETCKKILLSVAKIALIVVIAFSAGQRHAQKWLNLPQTERVDTLFIRDTIVSEIPIYKEKKVMERVLIPVYDTIRIKDTLYLYADREQVHWKDTLSDVYASGIDVSVDSVVHYIPTRIITKERDVYVKVKPKWSVGVQAGYGGAVHESKVFLSPYIGIGITYNLISW